MSRIIRLFALFVLISTLTISCLDSDDTEYSDLCYISSFTLGNVKRTMYTTSSTGEDSTYTISYSAGDFVMVVDQLGGTIQNKDSLPVRSVVTAVLASMEGSGVAYYSPQNSDAWYEYSSSDSIDFSSPLTFRVYSTDGTSVRDYTVKVNVHQTDGDVFSWNQISTSDLWADAEQIKLIKYNEQLYLYALKDQDISLYTSSLDDGSTWQHVETIGADNGMPVSITLFNNNFYMNLADSTLITSDDGIQWTEITTDQTVRLIAADETYIYALSHETLYRSNDAQKWKEETLDDDSQYLPVRDIAAIAYNQGNGQQRVLLAGSRSLEQFPSDTMSVVWSRTSTSGNDAQGWAYFLSQQDNPYMCPRLQSLQLVRYNDVLLALGLSSLDGLHQSFDGLYMSQDNGITWKADTDEYTLPDELLGTEDPLSVCVDDQYHLWIITNKAVWKGRLNRLGFAVQ